MAALAPPPPGPGAAVPPPSPGPSPSIPCLDSTTVDGGEPQHGTDGVGRVVDQEIDGVEPQTRTDGGGDSKMRTDAGGGKRKNPSGNSLVPTIIKELKFW